MLDHFVIHCVVTIVLWSTLHPFHSSEAVVRLDYQILLKSSPLTLLAGSAPGLRWTLVTKIHSVAVDRPPNLPTEKLTLYHWAIVTTPTWRAVFFHQGFGEPQGFASGCHGFEMGLVIRFKHKFEMGLVIRFKHKVEIRVRFKIFVLGVRLINSAFHQNYTQNSPWIGQWL